MIGNSGGKPGRSGRKSKAEELGLAALLDRVWTTADREKVIRSLHAKSVEGNEKAAALLLSYAYGKPTERVEHSNPDGSPLLSPIADALTKIYGATTEPTD
jgi:hypothetical protein